MYSVNLIHKASIVWSAYSIYYKLVVRVMDLEYTVEAVRAYALRVLGCSAGCLGSGSFAEKSLLALLSHTRKSSNLRVHIQHRSTDY